MLRTRELILHVCSRADHTRPPALEVPHIEASQKTAIGHAPAKAEISCTEGGNHKSSLLSHLRCLKEPWARRIPSLTAPLSWSLPGLP